MLTPEIQLPPGGLPPFLIVPPEDKRKKKDKGNIITPTPVPIIPNGPPN